MSQVDEILNSLEVSTHEHDVIDTDKTFTIDPFTRNIIADSGQKTIIVQGDHNSERFTFTMPRYIEGHDMALCNLIYVPYINSESEGRNARFKTGVYPVNDLTIVPDKDKVTFSWLISGNATKYEGNTTFSVLFSCVTGKRVDYRWSTNFYEELYVLKSLDSETSFENEYVEVIEAWKEAVKAEFAEFIDIKVQEYVSIAKDELNVSLTDYLNGHIEIFNNKINTFDEILRTEITKMDNDIDVLKARMDTFTSLPEGSTAGDAELADIRVDVEGKAHKFAGDAVRSQIGAIIGKMRKVVCDNLLNPDTVINGYISNKTGVITESDSYCSSDYIPVNAGDTITMWHLNPKKQQALRFVVAYDEDGNLLPNLGYDGEGSLSSYVIPEGVASIRISFTSSGENHMLLRNGVEPNAYIPYFEHAYYEAAEGFFDGFTKSETLKILSDKIIHPRDTSFFDASPNIFDGKFTLGSFVNQTTGELGVNEDHRYTDYIPIIPSTDYVISNPTGYYTALRYAIYDADKNFIFGERDNNHIPALDNAAYIRISVVNQEYAYDNLQIEKGTIPTPYRSSDEHLIPKRYLELGEPFIVNLPSKFYALVGEELNIYFDNLVEGHDTEYVFDVTCDVGEHLERGFRLVPDKAGSYSLNITVTKDGVTISKNSTIVVADTNAGSGKTKNVMIIGDSTTNNGIAVEKLLTNFENDSMNIVSLGTRGKAPKLHEGRSGWTFDLYFTTSIDRNDSSVKNPFYNTETATFDAAYYFENTGMQKPDYVIINLGINDTFSYKSDETLSEAIDILNSQCDAMIDSIKTVDSNIKVCVALTIPPNYSQDAFGKNYECNQTRARYKRNNVIWVDNLISKYDNRETERIYLIPIYSNLDTKYNMGMETVQYNKRNPATYEQPIANGGVHPVDTGYWQIADVYWFFLKAQE